VPYLKLIRMEIKTEYRGIEITYNEFSNHWICELTRGTATNKESLAECKKKIDEWFKKQNVKTPVISIYDNKWNKLGFGETATVTSITEDGEKWVSFEKGGRGKYSKSSFDSNFVKHTPENIKLIEAYKVQKEICNKEAQKANDIIESMERL